MADHKRIKNDTLGNALSLETIKTDTQLYVSRLEEELFSAIKNKDLDKLEQALNEISAHFHNDKRTAQFLDDKLFLLKAAEHCFPEACELLINKGASVNAKDKNSFTALYIASDKGNEKIVDLLLKNDALNIQENQNKLFPLHIAAANGNLGIVKKLIDHGAVVDIKQETYKVTPLRFAVENNHKEVSEYLLENGANPNAKDIQNIAPLDATLRNNNIELFKTLIEYCIPQIVMDSIEIEVSKAKGDKEKLSKFKEFLDSFKEQFPDTIKPYTFKEAEKNIKNAASGIQRP